MLPNETVLWCLNTRGTHQKQLYKYIKTMIVSSSDFNTIQKIKICVIATASQSALNLIEELGKY